MKRKLLLSLSLSLLLLAAAASLASCGHEHVPSGWIMEPKATCTSVGHRYKKCMDCGEILQEEDYNTTHNYEEGYCLYCNRPQNDEQHLLYQKITVDGKDGYTVAGIGNCHSIDLVIPEKHNSLPVLAISDNAFANVNKIESVTVPRSVLQIGARAFYGCQALKTVSFAKNSACTEIGAFAFADCPKLRTAELPADLTVIADSLFSGCLKLKNLTLPAGITRVGADAFGSCDELALKEEGGLTYLGSTANPYLVLMGVVDRDTTAVTPHADTKVIGPAALAGCVLLQDVILPEGLTAISPYAFSGCTALTHLSLPAAVTHLGSFALQDCRALAQITLSEGLTEIGTGAFYGCAALSTLTLPEGLTAVGAIAFYGCSSLQFNAHGTGRYLGTAANPYFLLCGFSSIEQADAPHADNRLIAAEAAQTPIA